MKLVNDIIVDSVIYHLHCLTAGQCKRFATVQNALLRDLESANDEDWEYTRTYIVMYHDGVSAFKLDDGLLILEQEHVRAQRQAIERLSKEEARYANEWRKWVRDLETAKKLGAKELVAR